MQTELSTDRTPRRASLAVGALLSAILLYQWQTSPEPSPIPRFRGTPAAIAAVPIIQKADSASFAQLIAANPLEALTVARDFHARTVRDYHCTFVKQELLPDGMSKEQVIGVKFQQQPFSIVMSWLRNPGKAVRVIYVAGRWVDEDAVRPEERDLALCQPGAIAAMFVKSVKQPIRGSRANEASRRYIDEFGFANALDLMIRFTRMAAERGELKLEFAGAAEFDGRPVWVLQRWTPFDGSKGGYPDAAAVYFIDQEWLVPVAIHSYADAERTKLLGRYEYRDVKINAGCTKADFAPETYGM